MKSSNDYNAHQDFVLVIVICLAIGFLYRLTPSQISVQCLLVNPW